MKQGGERAGVHHEPSRLAVHGAVYIKIEAVAHMHWDATKPAEIETGDGAGHARIHFQNQQLPLAIEERLGRKQNVGTEDPVDLVAFGRPPEPAEIDQDQRFIDQVQITEPNILRDGDGIERAVDAELRR